MDMFLECDGQPMRTFVNKGKFRLREPCDYLHAGHDGTRIHMIMMDHWTGVNERR